MFDDEDSEDECPPFALSRSTHKWLFLAAILEVFVDIFMAFHKLVAVGRDAALQKYRYDNDRLRFMDQVAVDIETITSGGLNATTAESGGSIGSRRIEPPN